MTTNREDNDVDSLLKQAKSRLDAGDAAAARGILERASVIRPQDVNVLMLLTLAYRVLGDLRAALRSINAVLAIEPYSFLALLSKGSALHDLGELHAAAEAYRAALTVAPPKSRIPASLHASMAGAERSIRQDAERLDEFLRRAIADERSRHAGAKLERFDECLAIFSGRAPRYVHEAALLYFPQLPAIAFYDNTLFPWLDRLEQATESIRDELLVVMKEDWGTFHPYIQYPKGSPLGQWKELNHSPAWSAFDLWRDGTKLEANCRRCPNTTALLESLPMAVQPGYGPTSMFSVLAPHAHIPAHTGSTNIRLIVHLPLILPPGCRYRVGNDHRRWELGKAWVFDDTIEHEAWNDSDEIRVLLMFDVWNPLITESERALVTAMMRARRDFK